MNDCTDGSSRSHFAARTTTKSTTTESGMIQSSSYYLLVCFGRNFVDVNIRLSVSHEGLIHRLSCALSELVLQSRRSFATSLDRVGKLGHNGEYVTDNTEVGDVEGRGVGIPPFDGIRHQNRSGLEYLDRGRECFELRGNEQRADPVTLDQVHMRGAVGAKFGREPGAANGRRRNDGYGGAEPLCDGK